MKGPEEDRQKRLRTPMSEEGVQTIKGPEEDRQKRLMPPMSEVGEEENQRA